MPRQITELRPRWIPAAAAVLAVMLAAPGCNNTSEPAAPGSTGTDLAVRSAGYLPAYPSTADSVTVTAVIANVGIEASIPTVARIAVGSSTPCSGIPVRALEPGEADTVTCRSGPRAFGTHDIDVCADASGLISESDENNDCSISSVYVSSSTEAADFHLPDANPVSPSDGDTLSPRDYLGQISAWYFGHST